MYLTRYLTTRSVRSRPLRTLLSMFGIVLGVGGVLAMGMTNQAAMVSIERVFEDASGRTDLSIISTSSSQGFSEQTVRKVSSVSGVKSAIPLLKAQTVLAENAPPGEIGISFLGASAGGFALNGIDPALDPLARDYRIESGRFLSGEDTAYEIVLVENYAAEEDIEIGDRISILTPNGVERLRVVGLMAREGPGLTNNGSFGVVPLQTAQRMFNRLGQLDQIDILLQDNSKSFLETLRQTIESRLGANYSVVYPAAQGQRMTQMLSNYQIGLNFLSGIALFVGAFLIYNAFAMTVVERTREFGMLRTIGMTRGQVIKQVMIEALLLGIIGSGLGILLGIGLSRGLANLMTSMLGSEIENLMIPLDTLLISLFTGIGVTVVAAILPAMQAGRISPITAVRFRGLSREGWLIRHGWKPGLALVLISTLLLVVYPFQNDTNFQIGSMVVFILFGGGTLMLPASVGLWERLTRPAIEFLYGSSGALGSRNTQRARSRTTLTVAAVMVGIAMIIVVGSMTSSFAKDLTDWLNAFLGGDLYISSSVPLRGDVARRIESVQGVEAVAQVRYLPAEWRLPNGDTETINLMAIEPVSYTNVTNFVFSNSNADPQAAQKRLLEGDAVFISSVISEKQGLQVGDTVQLKTRLGVKPFEVAAVIVDFYNQGMVMTINWSDLRRYYRVNDSSTYLVGIQPQLTAGEVETRIDQLYGKRYNLIIEANESVRGRIFNLMDQAFRMFDVLAMISVIVASLGVVNTITMNVVERTREIGMLRAVGMSRTQVIWMIMAEASLMGWMGGLIGLGFGVLLSWVFLQGMTAMSGYALDFVVPIHSVLLGLAVALIIAQAAALLPALRAASTRILDAIHYE